MGHDGYRVTEEQVAAFRLARNHLAEHTPADVAAVCRDVCGVQAQLMSAAELSLSARIRGLRREEIHEALWKQRTLVKTSAMRSTLHLLATDDLQIYLRALLPSRLRHMRRVMAKYGGISAELLSEVSDLAVDELRSGPLMPGELRERVLAKGLARGRAKKFFRLAWWGVVRQAIADGRVCYGPNRGKDVTVLRTQDWLPRQRAVTETEAKKTLLRRYLHAYGPATPQDFCKWSGLFGPEATEVWQRLRKELVTVIVDGREASLLARDLPVMRSSRFHGGVVRLLPNFDSYLLAHARKDHLVEPKHYRQVFRPAGWISPVVLQNGRVVGVWKLEGGKMRILLRVKFFGKITREVQSGLKEECDRMGEFLRAECRYKED
ncbi:MAG TPA: winged helix DNA-binding domain-containing protein [Candidatus Nitrosotenuis sp.]|nr:winged helix DNA-binding domain-containing protein [Candidatus Nitrosotenuis sp.]